jgi:hypothetical protein
MKEGPLPGSRKTGTDSHAESETAPPSLRLWLAKRDPTSIPIAETRNLGPVLSAQFAALGLHTFTDLISLGFEKSYEKLVRAFPERVHATAARALLGALLGLDWRTLPDADKARADAAVRTERLHCRAPAGSHRQGNR